VLARGIVVESDYVKAELKEFLRKSVFAVAHQDSAALFNAGKISEAYDTMAKAQETIQQVTFEKVERQWFFEELADRQDARLRAQSDFSRLPVRTGLPELDNLTDGGI